MLRWLLYSVGLLLSGVAAYYSVTGLAYVFAGAFLPVVLMGSALEAAKLVGASFVFQRARTAPKLLTAYISAGVLVLMLLTSLGIFGYLSRAYLVQQAPLTEVTAQLQAADREVERTQMQYTRDLALLEQSQQSTTADALITRLADRNRFTGSAGAVTVLRDQQAVQTTLQTRVQSAANALKTAEAARATLQQQYAMQTVDIGPLMFAAQAWYGNTDTATLDRAVRWLILLIMVAFDPMAIAMLLAAQQVRTAPRAARETQQTAAPVMPMPMPIPLREPVRTPEPPRVPPPPTPQTFEMTDAPSEFEFSAEPQEPVTDIDISASTDTETLATPTLPDSGYERPRWKNTRRRTRTAPKQ